MWVWNNLSLCFCSMIPMALGNIRSIGNVNLTIDLACWFYILDTWFTYSYSKSKVTLAMKANTFLNEFSSPLPPTCLIYQLILHAWNKNQSIIWKLKAGSFFKSPFSMQFIAVSSISSLKQTKPRKQRNVTSSFF